MQRSLHRSLEEEEEVANRRLRRQEVALQAEHRIQVEALRAEYRRQAAARRAEYYRQAEFYRQAEEELRAENRRQEEALRAEFYRQEEALRAELHRQAAYYIRYNRPIQVAVPAGSQLVEVQPAPPAHRAASASIRHISTLRAYDANRRKRRRRDAAAEDENYDQKVARALLKEKGFDPDDVNKKDKKGRIPICYYVYKGNVTMVRYLIARGADCRKVDAKGISPLFVAAALGHLEIIKLLYHDGGAHEDIGKENRSGYSPLRAAFLNNHFNVVKWLILNGALSSSPHAAVDGGGIEDAIMRRDLRQDGRRLPILAWAQTLVAAYANVHVFLTGTILSASSSSVCRPPKNPYATRSHKRRKVSTSPLVLFNGKSGILELIAHFVAGTPQQRHTLRQLVDHLPAFIAGVPFVDPPPGQTETRAAGGGVGGGLILLLTREWLGRSDPADAASSIRAFRFGIRHHAGTEHSWVQYRGRPFVNEYKDNRWKWTISIFCLGERV